MQILSIAGVVIGAALASGPAAAAEKKVKMQDLPAAVQQEAKEQTKNAILVGLSQEVEKGKTYYEVETKVNGHTRDVLLDAGGAIVEVEEEMALDSVPAAARASLEKSATGGKVTKVEKVTKGSAIKYEAAINKAGKKSEVTVAADGSLVKDE